MKGLEKHSSAITQEFEYVNVLAFPMTDILFLKMYS